MKSLVMAGAVCAVLASGTADAEDKVKLKPPTKAPTLKVAPQQSNGSPMRRRRRRCAPENRASCHGQLTSPIVTTGMQPELVLGQANFTTATAAAASATSLTAASGIAADANGTMVLIANDNRVSDYRNPMTPNQAMTFVIGQSSFTGIAQGSGAANLARPSGIAISGTKIAIVDSGNSRVVIHAAATANNPTPTLTLGTNGETSCKANAFSDPRGVWTDGTRLVVADAGNARVLIWRTFPTTNRAPDVVLGQPNLTTCNTGTGMAQMNYPSGVASDGTDLYVADRTNNRVLVFKSFATKANGAAAELVVGKTSATVGADTMNAPSHVVVHDGALLVGDVANHRVLVWDTLPTASGQPATHVLGQRSMDANAAPPAVAQGAFRYISGMAVAGDQLWVTDSVWHRAVRFPLYP